MPLYPFLEDDNEGVLKALRDIMASRLLHTPNTKEEQDAQERDREELEKIEKRLSAVSRR